MARKPIAPVSKPVEAVQAEAAPVAAPEAPLVFTNTTANTTIHLGDGRKLAPGESVEVTEELLRVLESGE